MRRRSGDAAALGAGRVRGRGGGAEKRWQPPERLTPEEVRAVIAAAGTERDRLLLRVLQALGGRISEVLARRAQDVLQGGVVVVPIARQRFRALQVIEDLEPNLAAAGAEQGKLAAALREFDGYVRVNATPVPNYGERYRSDEAISSAFVQVISKRMVKKQQMRWPSHGPICSFRSARARCATSSPTASAARTPRSPPERPAGGGRVAPVFPGLVRQSPAPVSR